MTSNPWDVCRRFGGLGECREPKSCTDRACHDSYADQHFLPKRPYPQPHYEPLIVTPKPSNKRNGQVVAFIGRQLCFFEKEVSPLPEVGKPIEVMITRPLFRKFPEGHPQAGYFDWSSVMALLLQPVTENFVLVDHKGFECSGSMCATTALLDAPKIAGSKLAGWLTPGRTRVVVADNVSSGTTWRTTYTALRPGKVWVDRHKYERAIYPLRAEGLARIEDGDYAAAVVS